MNGFLIGFIVAAMLFFWLLGFVVGLLIWVVS